MTALQRIAAKPKKLSSKEEKRILQENAYRRKHIQEKDGYEVVAKKSVLSKLPDRDLEEILQF